MSCGSSRRAADNREGLESPEGVDRRGVPRIQRKRRREQNGARWEVLGDVGNGEEVLSMRDTRHEGMECDRVSRVRGSSRHLRKLE